MFLKGVSGSSLMSQAHLLSSLVNIFTQSAAKITLRFFRFCEWAWYNKQCFHEKHFKTSAEVPQTPSVKCLHENNSAKKASFGGKWSRERALLS